MGKIETRGRKPDPRGKIESNGLYEDQWKRMRRDAQAQGVDGATLLRRAVDWYFSAIDSNIGVTIDEFEKLERAEDVQTEKSDQIDSHHEYKEK